VRIKFKEKKFFYFFLLLILVNFNLPAYSQTPSDAANNITKIKSELLIKKQLAQQELSSLKEHLQKIQSFISSLNSGKDQESISLSRQAVDKDNAAITKVESRLKELQRRLSLAEKAENYIKNSPTGQEKQERELGFAVTSLKGDVSVLRKGLAQQVKITEDMQFGPGDKITTGAGGDISLVMVDGSRIEISENSQFEIVDSSQDSSITKLNKGKIKAYVHKMFYRRYEVHTPSVAVSIRGTEFEINIDEKGHTHVTVYEGNVEIQKTFSITQGQSWSDKE
jgi:ferric-dicitrate binding protein FerR (iron transport regulator)